MKSKKIHLTLTFILLLLSTFLYAGCNEKNVTDRKTNVNRSVNEQAVHKITDFYCSEEYSEIDDLTYLNDVRQVNDTLYKFGIKEFNNNENTRYYIYSSTDGSIESANVSINYDGTLDAVVKDDHIYLIYLYNNTQYLSAINKQSGEELKRVEIYNYARKVEVTDQNIYVLAESMDRDKILTCYDLDLNYLSYVNLNKKVDSNIFRCNDILYQNNVMYLWCADERSVLYLYALDRSFNVIYKKEFTDMSTNPSNIFASGDNLVVTSSSGESELKYIDVIRAFDGEKIDWYEIDGVGNIYWEYSENVILCLNYPEFFFYNISEQQREDLKVPDWIVNNHIYRSGDNILSFPNIPSDMHAMCIKTDSQNNTVKIDFGNSSLASGVKSDGTIYCLSNGGNDLMTLSYYKDDGTVLNTIEINKNGYWVQGDTFCCTESNIYFSACDYDENDYILVYDNNGELLKNITTHKDVDIGKLIESNGNIYAFVKENKSESIVRVSDSGFEDIKSLSDISITNMFCGDDTYDFYYQSGSVIYGFIENEKKSDSIINLIDSGIIYYLNTINKIAEDTYFCSMTTPNDSVCLKLTRADDETLARLNSRKMIVAAGYDLDNLYFNEKITEFNLKNMDYFISVKDYASGSLSDYDFVSALADDIVKGNVPDLFIFNEDFNFKMFSSMGMFKDLSEYVENDPDIDRNDLFEEILNIYSDDKKLYGMAPSFSLRGIVLYDKDTENKLTYNEFLDKVESEKIKFKDITTEELYDYLIISKADEFIDYKKAECRFNSDEFIRLLKYIPTACSDDGTASISDIYGFMAIDYLEEVYGKDYKVIDVSGSGNSSITAGVRDDNGFAVSASSAVADGAWQFIRQFFMDDYQNNIWEFSYTGRFPLSRKAFNSEFEKQKTANGGESTIIVNNDPNKVHSFIVDISEDDKQLILDMIKNVSPTNNQTDMTVSRIISENIDMYIADEQSAEETARAIDQKESLYLEEISK